MLMNPLPCTTGQAQDTCRVCLDFLHSAGFAKKSVSAALPCRHLFHSQCIHRWSRKHITCPIDQRVILSAELQLPLPPDWQKLMVESARNGQHEQVQSLLSRGASVDAHCGRALTPFAIAAKNNHFATAQLLALHGATDPWGQLFMGNMYMTGKGVTEDSARAFIWFHKAAVQGLADAQFSLGYMYRFGHGVHGNITLAIDWLQKAAAQEHARALGLLGCICLENNTLTRDVARGLRLLEKAATKGSLLALNKLGVMHWSGQHVQVDLPRAQLLLEQAAKRNFFLAQINLARFYLASKDPGKLPQAIALLESAVNQRAVEAMIILGGIYWHRLQDPSRAFQLFQQAAQLGEPRAYYHLAIMHNLGAGTPKDAAKALHHLHQAAARGYTSAQFRLGLAYWLGLDHPRDLHKAEHWFAKAAENGHKEAKNRLNHIRQSAKPPQRVSISNKKTKKLKRLQRGPKPIQHALQKSKIPRTLTRPSTSAPKAGNLARCASI